MKTGIRDGLFWKEAETIKERKLVANEYAMLTLLGGTGIAASVEKFDREQGILAMSVIESCPMTDEVAFQRSAARLLGILLDKGIRHGDLTNRNMIAGPDNSLWAVDFAESLKTPLLEGHKPKRPEPDAHHLWRGVLDFTTDSSRMIRRWAAIREYLVPGQRVFDLGCYQGDFCLMAAVEGHSVVGIDHRDHDEGEVFPAIVHQDVMATQIPPGASVLLLSAHSQLVAQVGGAVVDAWLGDLIARSHQVFFETQLLGDGPGTFQTQAAVQDYLAGVSGGKVVWPIVTLPVAGREPLTRTVYRIGGTG